MTTETRRLNIAQEIARERCEFKDEAGPLKEVVEHDDVWAIVSERGTGFSLSKEYGVEPKVGDELVFYGQFGMRVQGVDLNGEPVFFKTEAELEFDHAKFRLDLETKRARQFEEAREQLDADYARMHPAFQKRLDRFRAEDPNFRWSDEGYESFCLVEATVIIEKLKTAEAVEALMGSDKWKQQEEAVPELRASQHSGNTWGAAWAMAHRVLSGGEV